VARMGNSRSPILQMRVPSRRIFYAAITTWISDRCRRDADDGVVKDARSFIHRNSQPLLTSPPQVVETMYWYEIPDEGYQLTLGPWSFPPPPPTWRKFFISEGIPHRTESEIERICSSHLIEPGDFDKPMSVRYWEEWFEIEGGPLARAYHLLQKIDLGPERGSERGPLLEFNIGSHPGDSTHFVNAKDMLSLSLLQARLIDLKLPIKIVEGD
jgi:hypothetical protein